MAVGYAVLETGKLVGAIQIRFCMAIQIQIHGLCLVTRSGYLEVGPIEFQVLKIIQREARQLVMRRKGGRVLVVANRRLRRITGRSIFSLGSLGASSMLVAFAVRWMSSISYKFLSNW